MERWEIFAVDGTFLALRYDKESAVRCAEEFAPRWGTVFYKKL